MGLSDTVFAAAPFFFETSFSINIPTAPIDQQ
jgi:hypothetical protein